MPLTLERQMTKLNTFTFNKRQILSGLMEKKHANFLDNVSQQLNKMYDDIWSFSDILIRKCLIIYLRSFVDIKKIILGSSWRFGSGGLNERCSPFALWVMSAPIVSTQNKCIQNILYPAPIFRALMNPRYLPHSSCGPYLRFSNKK